MPKAATLSFRTRGLLLLASVKKPLTFGALIIPLSSQGASWVSSNRRLGYAATRHWSGVPLTFFATLQLIVPTTVLTVSVTIFLSFYKCSLDVLIQTFFLQSRMMIPSVAGK
ncbi:hypothetical protein ACOSQ3_006089 [Xanthoceras sorbifolium]